MKDKSISASELLRKRNPELFTKLITHKDNNKEEWENYFPGKERLRDLSTMELALYSEWVKKKDNPSDHKPPKDNTSIWPHSP